MSDKNVVIIGSNRGIGLALVREYLHHGWKVFAVSRSSSNDLLELGHHPDVTLIEGIDVTIQDDRSQLSRLLPPNVNEVVHNAGILYRDNIWDINEDDMIEQFKVNTIAPLQTLLVLKPHLSAGAKVGIITSRMGSIGDCARQGMVGYRVSKAGVNMVGKNLANAWEVDGITVLLLHPGYVRTDMTNGNGLISPAESAHGLYKRIREKDIQSTGTFWHTNGERLEW